MKHTCETNGRSGCEACVQFEIALWDAINRYATSVGGDPSTHVYGNAARMQAVADVGRIDAIPQRRMTKVFVVHVFDNADHLHDYYVHQTAEGAVRQAATDLVGCRFEDADPDFFEIELRRVLDAVYAEPATGRRHVRCDAWRAHVDEMQVLS